ncbi:ankyrin repeat domain-containing protein SOWAHD [Limanda limanda]|uniref:ankyrin repeat domain-containing protein SOWAHD n=1 Tax=Limanda limanda TaxID=27771 RepID=UPI0029C7887F|nr:ankyrin repeat domain-containing protein SOWAHD [Limanda limanda]XP_060935843.1 ankyrin repeat domain-containing protein SOWAHD [Limanda limanda]
MNGSRSDDAGSGSEAAVGSSPDALGGTQGTVVARLSRYGLQVLPGSVQRRSRLQRQQQAAAVGGAPGGPQPGEAPERGSLTPAMRKKYLKELFSTSGFSSALSSQTETDSLSPGPPEDADWALCPMEHAWMLSAVEGNYDTILEFVSEDPSLLTRRDVVSGYSVLHWLSKRGQDETLLRLLHYAENQGIRVDVDVRGSGGLTPLHVASMHSHYMVVKLLVGAFSANVDIMDYNGRRAWQYLRGDAPLEMKELLGTWDEEHSFGAGNINNSASSVPLTPGGEEGDEGHTEGDSFDRTKRSGSWRFGSFKKMLPSFSFFGNKS